MATKDLFSKHSSVYSRFRPTYPDTLFDYLASLPAEKKRAWDCATGNGQAAIGLAGRFDEVIATDLSQSQLDQAAVHPRVKYHAARAEESGLADASANLVTVAQALHWFELDQFYAEVKRVLKPDGALAVWSYALMTIDPEFDRILLDFYRGPLDQYWDPARRLVDEGYRSLAFPFTELQPPPFEMKLDWSFEHVRGYLDSWSAVQTAKRTLGRDLLDDIRPALLRAWGDPTALKTVRWPLAVRVGRVTKQFKSMCGQFS